MTGSRQILTAVAAVVIFVVGAAVGWFAKGDGSMPSDVPTVVNYDGWRLSCPPASRTDLPCAISNDLIDNKNQRRVAQLSVVSAKNGPVLVIGTPFNVLLAAGVGLGFGDAKPKAYPYLTCNGAGCIAEIPLSDDLRDQMRQGGQAKLVLGDLNRKAIAILFSLKGFDRADDALKAHQNGSGFLGMGS